MADTFNPLDCIDDTAEDFLDQCRDLADMLVVRTGHEKDPHWNDSARMVLTAFIAFICSCETDPTQRTLDGVRRLISSRSGYEEAIATMQEVDSHEGVIQREGGKLTWFVEEELGSVMTTTQRHTEFLDSPIIKRNTATSSFDPMSLRTGRVTIYLCLPHDKLITLSTADADLAGRDHPPHHTAPGFGKEPGTLHPRRSRPYRKNPRFGRSGDAHAGHGNTLMVFLPIDSPAP